MTKQRNNRKPHNKPVTLTSLLSEVRAGNPRKPDESPSEWAKRINALLDQQAKRYGLFPSFRRKAPYRDDD